jgi:hypothetical protein
MTDGLLCMPLYECKIYDKLPRSDFVTNRLERLSMMSHLQYYPTSPGIIYSGYLRDYDISGGSVEKLISDTLSFVNYYCGAPQIRSRRSMEIKRERSRPTPKA